MMGKNLVSQPIAAAVEEAMPLKAFDEVALKAFRSRSPSTNVPLVGDQSSAVRNDGSLDQKPI